MFLQPTLSVDSLMHDILSEILECSLLTSLYIYILCFFIARHWSRSPHKRSRVQEVSQGSLPVAHGVVATEARSADMGRRKQRRCPRIPHVCRHSRIERWYAKGFPDSGVASSSALVFMLKICSTNCDAGFSKAKSNKRWFWPSEPFVNAKEAWSAHMGRRKQRRRPRIPLVCRHSRIEKWCPKKDSQTQ